MKRNVKTTSARLGLARLVSDYLPALTRVFLSLALLLLATPARAQIALQDGSTNIVYHASGGAVSTNFTVTTGASVLVVELFNKGAGSAGAEPATLSWGSQTLIKAVSEPDTSSTFRDCTIYYLYNPTPGTQTISATVTGAGVDLQVYTLSGVNTAIPPLVAVVNAPNGQNVLVTVPNILAGSWAIVNAFVGSNPGTPTVSSTSGTVNVAYDTTQAGPIAGLGYVSSLNPGSVTITATTSAASSKMAMAVAVFSPPQTGAATITQQPAPVSAFVGETATFVVGATGANLTFQWSVGTSPIPGATNAVLTVTNVSQSANYSVVVTSSSPTATVPSSAAALTVNAPILQHRYSFVTDASDSVGGAAWNGTLVPPTTGGPATINNGLSLPGNAGGGNGVSGYVSLPNGIVKGDSSVTVECWVQATAVNTWAEIWDFGVNGSTNFALIQDSPGPGDMRVAFAPNGGETDINTPSFLPADGNTYYTAVTYNNSTLTGNLYLNGALNGTVVLPPYTSPSYSPGTFGGAAGTTENYLGNDVFGDPQFAGTIYELRIWNGALPQRLISASALLGPGTTINTNLSIAGASFGTVNNMVATDTQQASVYVTIPQTGASELLATSDVTNWTSANTSVLTVSSTGLISAVAPGTTTISANIGGFSVTSSSITVTPQVLQHRYSFVSDASDSVGGPSWDGTLVPPGTGTAATIANGLILPGTTGGTQSGYVTLPSGIIQGDSSVTVECWVTQNASREWSEIWDFGINNRSYNFALIPDPGNNGGNLEVANFGNGLGNDEIDSATAFPNGVEQYVAVTFNNSTLVGSLYTNGVLDARFKYPGGPLDGLYSPGIYGGAGGTVNNYLGADIYGDAQFDGTIYELRIWNGAVSPLYLEVSTAAGAGVVVTDLTPHNVTVSVPSTSILGAQTEQATVVANFAAASGVTVTGGVTNWLSSNTNVLTVSASGLITGVANGSATVSATVGGVTATSAPISVASTPPVITQQPVGVTTAAGDSATFTAVAAGGQLSYQWEYIFNNVTNAIPGATNATLTLNNLALTNAGSYYINVSNPLGSSNSVAVLLTVDQAILMHRYSFVSDASDSVGTANGTLIAGNNPATINNGLALPGTGTSGNPSGYVSLPNGMVQGDDSVTVECWVTQNAAREWAEIWSFGVLGGSVNFGLIPDSSSGNMRVAFTPNGGEIDINSPGLPSGTEEYLAVTFDNSALVGNLYLNGVLDSGPGNPGTVSFAAATPHSPGNYGATSDDTFGADPYGGDDQFNGTIYELRIWNGVVPQRYLAASTLLGPSVLVNQLTPTSASLTVTTSMAVLETQQGVVTVQLPQTGATDLPATGDAVNWISSNPLVLTVSATGLITAVGGGTATISATVGGVAATSPTITVTAAPVIIAQPTAVENLLAGGTLHATVRNVGQPPYLYYWYFNNGAQPIAGATTATLRLSGLQAASAGSYTCVITNNYGSVTSTPTVITITAPNPYQANLLALGPLAYWPLDETTGTVAYDMAGGYNGNYVGNFVLQQPGPANSFFGATSYAASFDGSTAYVDVPEGPFNLTNAITVVTWVNVAAYPNFAGLFGHGDASWRLSVNGTGEPGASDGTAGDATSRTGILDGNWHFVAYAYDGTLGNNNGLLYVDGALVASNSVTVTPVGDALDVWIGGAPDYGTARLLNASIAHAAIFTQALPAAVVNALYTGQPIMSITPSGTSVVITWPSGTLLQAPTVVGPWTPNNAAVSPYTVPATIGNQFFQVKQ
ncbi:MAG: LamG-like jellyroll fold domain-containing protein [Verrucomicrobiota bacterium]|jgi:uncharacterized protein YjdB